MLHKVLSANVFRPKFFNINSFHHAESFFVIIVEDVMTEKGMMNDSRVTILQTSGF